MKYCILKPFVLMTLLIFILFAIAVAKSSTIHTYTILEGENLLVVCNATNSSDTEIYWTKNDTESSFIEKGRFLEILNINRSYSGDYICHALNTSFPVPEYNETDSNVTVDVINVDVQYPAEIEDFSIEPYELMENDTFNVTCNMQANPEPTWTIRNRNGRQLITASVSANATIGPVSVSCDDMGYWECTGRNDLNNGVNVSRGHNITVYCSPRPQYERNHYVVQARVGQYTILIMYLLAYPKANYTWTKDDGTDISKVVKQDNFERETLLTFPTMTVSYFGNYTLKMQNEYGSYLAHYQIEAYGAPETPTHLHFSDLTYNSVKLHWTSGFDMGSRQHFIVIQRNGNSYSKLPGRIYDNSTNHGINQNWTYVLTGLVSDTYYNLSIMAENEKGFMSQFSKPPISFRTKDYPKTDKSSSPDVKLIVGLSLGTIATVGMLAFMVYVVKNRKLRASYVLMNGQS